MRAGQEAHAESWDVGNFCFPAGKSYWRGKKIDLYDTLEFPERASGKVSAMVILHGRKGQGYRVSRWGKFLLENGVAMFKVDWLSPRGMSWSAPGASKNPYDLISAVKFLSTHPHIDPTASSIPFGDKPNRVDWMIGTRSIFWTVWDGGLR